MRHLRKASAIFISPLSIRKASMRHFLIIVGVVFMITCMVVAVLQSPPPGSSFVFTPEEIALNRSEIIFRTDIWWEAGVLVLIAMLSLCAKIAHSGLKWYDSSYKIARVCLAFLGLFLGWSMWKNRLDVVNQRRVELTRAEIQVIETQLASDDSTPGTKFDVNKLPIKMRFDSWGVPYQIIPDGKKWKVISKSLLLHEK